MKTLLNEEYAPTTSAVGFFEDSLDVVADAFESWRQEITLFRRVTRVALEGDLASSLESLLPLCRGGYTKDLLVSHGNWTAYFSDGSRGSDPAPPLRHMGSVLQCRTVFAEAVPHTILLNEGAPRRQGGVQFYLKDPVANTQRGISITFDGHRGTFDQIGEPLPFETVANYSARKLWDRFNSTQLEALCAQLGIRLFDPAAYGRAVRFDMTTVGDWGRDVIDLAGAQAALGIVPGQAASLPG